MAVNKRKILEAARKYAQKGAKAKALKEYERLLRIDSSDAKLRLELGDAYRRWGQVAEAVETYLRVAEQFSKEGFEARAVAVYKQLQNLQPDAFHTYAPLAELYQRMGLTAEAVHALQTAAEGYQKAGKKHEALDLLRRMAALDPANTTSRFKVADLLRQEGLVQDAVSEYEALLAELERQGDLETATRVCERMLELEPERIDTLMRLSGTLLRRGSADGAEPHVRRALELRPEEPEILERLAEVYKAQRRDSELVDTYRRLADAYGQRGDEDRAREIRQRFVPPEDLQVDAPTGGYETEGESEPVLDLAEVGEEHPALDEDLLPEDAVLVTDGQDLLFAGESGDEPLPGEAPQEWAEPSSLRDEDEAPPPREEDEAPRPLRKEEDAPRRLPEGDPDQLVAEASVYLRYGKREQAIASLEAVVANDPEHRVALEKLGEALAEGGSRERAVESWQRAAELAVRTGDLDGLRVLRGRIESLDPAGAAAFDPTPVPPSAPPAAARAPAPEPRDPGPAEAEATALNLSGAAGSSAEATIVGGHGGDLSGADETGLDDIEIDIDVDAFEIDDEAAADLDPGAETGNAAAPAPESDAADAADAGESLEDEESVQPEGEEPEAEKPECAVAEPTDKPGFDPVTNPGASSSTSQQILEDLEEADFYLKQGLTREAESLYQRVLSIAPNHPRALVRLGELAAARGEDPGSTGTGLVPPAEATSDAAAGDEAFDQALADFEETGDPVADLAEPESAGEPASVESAMTDLDLEPPDEEAVADPDPAPDELPDDPPSDPEGDPAPAGDDTFPEVPPGAGTPQEESAVEAGFDLAAEISDAFDGDAKASSSPGLGDEGFATVFREFKKGVSQTLSDSDYDTHYDLGIAYREMGLVDDAAQEFRCAMASADRRIEALHMLGLCAREAGRAEEAVDHFEQVIASPEAGREPVLAARFELGLCFQELGDVARTRECFEGVVAADPTFQDAEERLAAIDRDKIEGDAPVAPAPTFESFDDVIAEAGEDDTPVESAAPTFESFDDVVADAEPDPDPDPEAELEPEPEPGSEPEEASPSEDPPQRKKKRISFV